MSRYYVMRDRAHAHKKLTLRSGLDTLTLLLPKMVLYRFFIRCLGKWVHEFDSQVLSPLTMT